MKPEDNGQTTIYIFLIRPGHWARTGLGRTSPELQHQGRAPECQMVNTQYPATATATTSIAALHTIALTEQNWIIHSNLEDHKKLYSAMLISFQKLRAFSFECQWVSTFRYWFLTWQKILRKVTILGRNLSVVNSAYKWWIKIVKQKLKKYLIDTETYL